MAVRVNHIFPECYVDTNILKTLLQVDGVNHQYGCTRVIAGMETGKDQGTLILRSDRIYQ